MNQTKEFKEGHRKQKERAKDEDITQKEITKEGNREDRKNGQRESPVIVKEAKRKNEPTTSKLHLLPKHW